MGEPTTARHGSDPRARRRAAARRARRRAIARRRRIALGALAMISLLAGAAVGAGAGEEDDSPEPRPLGELLGTRLIVRMEGEATAGLRRAARAGRIAGVILFPPEDVDQDALSRELERLQRAARRGGQPPLLVTIDQEGGVVKRLAGPPRLSPPEIAARGERDVARREGEETGRFLTRLGINVDLAPVLDVPVAGDSFLAERAFGATPASVTEGGVGFAEGLQAEGVAATAKHFPGLGLAAQNTDLEPVSVDASVAALRADLQPFRAAIGNGVQLVMLSNATYPALDPSAPAALSGEVVAGELRGELGFQGVTISDDLHAGAITAERSPRRAAVEAARAGVDLLLFARDDAPGGTLRALRRAARSGELSRAALEASAERVEALRAELGAA